MNPQSTYLSELYATAIGIVCSPMVFYMLLRYKLGLENEQGKTFRTTYAETLKEPKTKSGHLAEITVYAVLIVLVALGYATDEVIFDFLAGVIGFSLIVEWLWRVEVGE